MDEDGKKYPSLPSNYVTLVQLQERWLKKQQRKQGEKEEQEEGKQREKEEFQNYRSERAEAEKSSQESMFAGENSKSDVPRLPFHRSRWNQYEKSSRTIGVSERKPEELQIGAIVVDDGERKIDGSKGKERKLRAEEDRKGGKEQLLPENKAEEKIPVGVSEGKREKEVTTCDIRRNGNNRVVNGRVWDKKVRVDRSAEIGRKFEGLSVSGEKGGNARSYGNVHGVHWQHNRGSGMFDHRKLKMPRDSTMVWVRKGDTSEANVA